MGLVGVMKSVVAADGFRVEPAKRIETGRMKEHGISSY
jgi:hypothetical protein